MPVIIMTVLKTIGSTLVSMAMAMLTGPVIKQLIIMAAEQGVAWYERKAAATPLDKSDDAIAKFCRDILTMAEKEWAKQ